MCIRSRFLFVLLLSISLASQASEDLANDELILKIAKREKASFDEVKKALQEGCSSGITPYMRQCAYLNSVGEDITLNETYQQVFGALKTQAARQKLVKAQRAWLNFRDAACDYEANSWTGGTGYGVIHSSCLATMARNRSRELQSYLDCQGLSGCPGDAP
jgi:uncharacterized protein YecT (DUF1311 family)